MEPLNKIAGIVTISKIFKGADVPYKINLIVKKLYHAIFMN